MSHQFAQLQAVHSQDQEEDGFGKNAVASHHVCTASTPIMVAKPCSSSARSRKRLR